VDDALLVGVGEELLELFEDDSVQLSGPFDGFNLGVSAFMFLMGLTMLVGSIFLFIDPVRKKKTRPSARCA
jgi:hypothetical protein